MTEKDWNNFFMLANEITDKLKVLLEIAPQSSQIKCLAQAALLFTNFVCYMQEENENNKVAQNN